MRVEINIVHMVIIGRPYACIQQAGKHFLPVILGTMISVEAKLSVKPV